MIQFAGKEYIERIKELWRTVFGDGEQEIDDFLSRYWGCVLIYTENDAVLGMLSLLPLRAGRHTGRYIYAVATAPAARGRGISTRLLHYANEYILRNGGSFSVLVPAEKSLFDFYAKRGYTPISAVKLIETDTLSFASGALNTQRITPERLFTLRRNYFKRTDFIEWGAKEIEYISRLYEGHLYEITSDKGRAFAVCACYGGMLDIKELCSRGIDEMDCINVLNAIFKTQHCRAVIPFCGGHQNAMVYPSRFSSCYFNLAMD